MPYKFLSDMPCSLCSHTVRCCAANQASLMDVAKQELHFGEMPKHQWYAIHT